MKFIRKKTIRDKEYYFFEYPVKIGGKRKIFSRYFGSALPVDLATRITNIFEEIADRTTKNVDLSVVSYFAPQSVRSIESARFWYQSLHHELFESDLSLFRSLFGILFILNSNRAEGSKVTRKDIEKLIKRKQKPKTQLDLEIINSLAALCFAFSKNMKWNLKSLKNLHCLLLDRIAPEIAGKFKRQNVVIGNEPTADWKSVKKELRNLLRWFSKNKKRYYPPLLALEFHHRFEGIHPFEDGNGRAGRLLCNAFLLQQGYMPVIFFNENHKTYGNAISLARQGRKKKLAHYFIKQIKKTRKAVEQYRQAGIIHGGSPQVGQWEIERGKIRRF